MAPLWSGYPDAALVRPRLRFIGGFAIGTALAFSVVLFERSPGHNLVVFFHHTIGFQYGRSAPFSLWDWRQYHARGLPDLSWVQRVLQVVLVAGALVLARWPRHRTPLRLAAYTGALLVGFEAILTYWSFSYLIWFFPFVAYAVRRPPADGRGSGQRGTGRGRGRGVDLARGVRARPLDAPAALRRRRGARASSCSSGRGRCSRHGPYANPRIIDTPIYQQYGDAIRSHLVPYRDFAVEYPPGALLPFFAATFGSDYRSTFGWLMAGCGLLCLLFIALARPPGRAWVFLAVSPLLIGSIALTRFDFWPAALAVGSLAAFLRDRHRLGWAALGAAFAAKLFPAVLVPLAIVWTLRRRGQRELVRGLAWFAAAVLAIFVPFFILAPRGMWDSLIGELSRPLQIETLPAVVIRTFGHPTIVGIARLAQPRRISGARHHGHGRPRACAGGGLGRLCARAGGGRAADSLLGGQHLRVHRLREGALAAVPDLARAARAARPRPPRARGDEPGRHRGRRWTRSGFPGRYYDYVSTGHLAWLVLVRDLVLLGLLAVLAVPASHATSPERCEETTP